MELTLAVSQLEIFPSKTLAYANMYLMSVTLETSQLPISWLNTFAS